MSAPSPWLLRWRALLKPQMSALDLACGGGRHVRWLSEQGLRVTGVDRDAEAIAALRDGAEIILADVESGPWPLAGRRFDLVLVTNYLWRPLLPQILASVAPGGCLIYETFATGHEEFGRPRRPEFLLKPNELLELCAGMRLLGFEQGYEAGDDNGKAPRVMQRIAAQRLQ